MKAEALKVASFVGLCVLLAAMSACQTASAPAPSPSETIEETSEKAHPDPEQTATAASALSKLPTVTETPEDTATPTQNPTIDASDTEAGRPEASPALPHTPTATTTQDSNQGQGGLETELSPTSVPPATSTPATSTGSNAGPSPTPTEEATLVATSSDEANDDVPSLVETGSVGLGAYLEGTPYDEFVAVEAFQTLIGHRLEYVLWFQSWGDDDRVFPDYWIQVATEKGFVPVITWEPWKRDFVNPTGAQPAFSLGSIAAGEHDEYIRSWASASRSTGVPIIIRFAHEQSTEPGSVAWYPWQGDPQAYRAAFRHVVSIFREEGADNVEFLWSAMWLDKWASEYYPGDDVVDYVGTTVLNHGLGATADWAQWRSFDDWFHDQYQAALQWGKPIIVTELATAEQGGDKPAWLRDCYSSLEPDYPLVRGVLLLEVESDREWPEINWSVASSPESLAAFQEVIDEPYFR